MSSMLPVTKNALEDRISQYNRSIVDFYATKKDLATTNVSLNGTITDLANNYVKKTVLSDYVKTEDLSKLSVRVDDLEKRLNKNDASSLSGITSSGVNAVGTGFTSGIGAVTGLFGSSNDQPPPVPPPAQPTKKGGIKKSRKPRTYKRKSYKKRTNK